MPSITVTRLRDGREVTVEASNVQILLDHLEASAARHGFEVIWNEPREYGHINLDGKSVAIWEVSND